MAKTRRNVRPELVRQYSYARWFPFLYIPLIYAYQDIRLAVSSHWIRDIGKFFYELGMGANYDSLAAKGFHFEDWWIEVIYKGDSVLPGVDSRADGYGVYMELDRYNFWSAVFQFLGSLVLEGA